MQRLAPHARLNRRRGLVLRAPTVDLRQRGPQRAQRTLTLKDTAHEGSSDSHAGDISVVSVAVAPPPAAIDLSARLSELLRPDAFTHRATDIQLHETHISWVILAGPYAYKIRKPVNFGFLDFSSPEQRLADCEAEISLNRRLCPDLYL